MALSVQIVRHYGFFREKIGTNRGLVLTREFARRKTIEERCLADTVEIIFVSL